MFSIILLKENWALCVPWPSLSILYGRLGQSSQHRGHRRRSRSKLGRWHPFYDSIFARRLLRLQSDEVPSPGLIIEQNLGTSYEVCQLADNCFQCGADRFRDFSNKSAGRHIDKMAVIQVPKSTSTVRPWSRQSMASSTLSGSPTLAAKSLPVPKGMTPKVRFEKAPSTLATPLRT